jgi:hypothetical protein
MNNHIATPPYYVSHACKSSLQRPNRFPAPGLHGAGRLQQPERHEHSSANPVNWITPYKIDVIQGNFVSKEQVEQLRPGMTRDQVKATLGTPLMASLFHADRWDYVFTLKRQGVEPQSQIHRVLQGRPAGAL